MGCNADPLILFVSPNKSKTPLYGTCGINFHLSKGKYRYISFQNGHDLVNNHEATLFMFVRNTNKGIVYPSSCLFG